jgi:hypothetical protein
MLLHVREHTSNYSAILEHDVASLSSMTTAGVYDAGEVSYARVITRFSWRQVTPWTMTKVTCIVLDLPGVSESPDTFIVLKNLMAETARTYLAITTSE